jgi:hypothetical protein
MPIGTPDEILSFIEGSGVIRVSRVVVLKKIVPISRKVEVCWFLTTKRIMEKMPDLPCPHCEL